MGFAAHFFNFGVLNGMKPVDVAQLSRVIEPVITGQGYELVDVEWKNESGWILRVQLRSPWCFWPMELQSCSTWELA